MINSPHIIEAALLLLAIFLIGCALGYVARRYVFSGKTISTTITTEDEPASCEAAPETGDEAEATPQPSAPVSAPPAGEQLNILSESREGEKDNLKLIKGIGPGIEVKLNDMGIYHFDQIASWDRKTIQQVDEALSFKGRIDRENWISQAKELALPSKD